MLAKIYVFEGDYTSVS